MNKQAKETSNRVKLKNITSRHTKTKLFKTGEMEKKQP